MEGQAAPKGSTPGAWLVHAFTGTGAVISFLAVMAIEAEAWRLCLLWLLVALAVDGVDGSLARWANTKERAGRVDGDILDLVIDYLSYVFVPTIFMWKAGFFPEPLVVPLVAAIQLSSLYLFARTDMKTKDNYFRGFPSLWNVVAFYLYVGGATPEVGAIAVAFFALLTFAPVHFVHPFRVTDYGKVLPLLALAWAAATVALLWPGWSEPVRTALLWGSLAAAAVMIGMGLLRTFRGSRAA
jgi:phosphatidylcholine synthase